MKKLVQFALILLITIAGLFILRTTTLQTENKNSGYKGGDNVLNIYNWGDYIDPTLLKDFSKKTGYRVNYETFDSNEAMYTKVKQGGTNYDLIVPSEYMIQKMKDEKL
ncbi:MAG: spermidine/putrescine ABC transporter substrate-binding protein, partial [Lactobacillaceae bacterium]|nr:spermidine/putrescine ABC transporter substrate-binding protein [Lactobacillaceae bacterium]